MKPPIKVTFDHNTYELVVSPDKPTGGLSEETRIEYRKINSAIKEGLIIPFISETILTIETLNKEDRKNILSSKDRLIFRTEEISKFDKSFKGSITMQPNHELYPSETDHFYKYLPKAIELGFKILPNYRLGKLVNPAIKNSWYYLIDTVDPLEVPNKFSSIIDFIESAGYGFTIVKQLLNYDEAKGKSWVFFLDRYTGIPKTLKKGIAEWSDADSIAVHIALGIDVFCTLDGAGKNNKNKSVLGRDMRSKLENKYGVVFSTPSELLNEIS